MKPNSLQKSGFAKVCDWNSCPWLEVWGYEYSTENWRLNVWITWQPHLPSSIPILSKQIFPRGSSRISSGRIWIIPTVNCISRNFTRFGFSQTCGYFDVLWPLGIMTGGESRIPENPLSLTLTTWWGQNSYMYVQYPGSFYRTAAYVLLKTRILRSVVGFGLLTFRSVFLLRQPYNRPFPSA